MLVLAARMLRHRIGSAVATFLALVGGVVVLMACALLVESGLAHTGVQQRYAAATAVVAVREVTVTSQVLGETESTTVPLAERGTVPAGLVDQIAALPGVAAAVADTTVALTPLAAPTVPTTGHGWGSSVLAPYGVVSGAPPRSDDEIAVDARLAGAGGLAVGGTTAVLTGGTRREFRVTGIVEAAGGPVDGTGSTVFFTDAQAAELARRPGRVDAVGVLADPGADQGAVVDAVRDVATGAGARTYAGQDRGLVEQPEAAAGRSLAIQAGGAFGGYAAVIVGFVVAATVGLSVRHRRRDLALLRAVAATPGQVRRLILGEVGLITLLAAVVGVPAGFAAADWARDGLVARGFVPAGFAVRGGLLSALAVTAAVTVVALLSALVAARRTATIRPTEALGEVSVEPAAAGRVRAGAGLVLLAGGFVLVGLAGAATGQTALGAAVGMVYAFVLAVALLAPWINLAAARLLAPVLRAVWGSSGHVAAANLRATARGTVAVLTALVLSVGFGGTVWFLQDNIERQTATQSRDGTLAQQALTGAAGLPAAAVDEARGVPGVVAATGVRRTSVVVDLGPLGGAAVVAQGIDVDGADRTLDLAVTSGSLAELRGDTVAVSRTQAESAGWELGDTVDLWLGDGTPARLRVVAVYERGLGFGDVTLARATVAGHTTTDLDDQVLVRTADGADGATGADGAVTAALADLAARYPAARVVGADQLTGELARDLAISAWLNQLLTAVLIGYAALAAANTLVMAALARTRELSVLRLAGMTRRQVLRMVHAEQAGLLGVALAIGVVIAAVSLSSIVAAVAGERVPHVPAAGWVAVLGGTSALALLATILPVRRVLRTPPVAGTGVRE